MRACPVCRESFTDDYNFCDLDGAALATTSGSPSVGRTGERVWNLLGVGLLVGALVISAVSIIFLPRADVQIPVPRETVPVNGSKAGNTASSSDPAIQVETPQSVSELPGTVPEKALSDLKASQKALPIPRTDDDTLAPKALARSTESGTPRALDREQPSGVAESTSIAATRESLEPAAKPATVSGELKKEPRREKDRSVAKESNTNGAKGKEKKGGFLRVFKKIFGKN